ncbi:MAG: hypothetical protein KGM98_15780 [Bacteroidota bacterium]|nr:hypothetical protein [Bacteroidota bacterium]
MQRFLNNRQAFQRKITKLAIVLSVATKRWSLLSLGIFGLSISGMCQKSVITPPSSHFSGEVTLTNNGISLIPTFTLNKPAVIVDLALGKGRLSFEPEFSFGLDGKPWNFLFWWRYKIAEDSRFKLNIGVHPAFAFRTASFTTNGVSQEYTVAQRYLAGEIVPSYSLSSHVSIGIYYLYSMGLTRDATASNHFLTLNASFDNLALGPVYRVSFTPQVYYLNLAGTDGFYITHTLALTRKDFPLSLTSTLNKALHTHVDPKQDFVWNVAIIYSFSNNYVKVKKEN